MAINTSKVIDRLDFLAPEHASKSKSLKEEAVSAAIDQRINTTAWADAGKLIDGAAHLAAHLLTMRERRSELPGSSRGTGPVASVSEGDESISWSNPGTGDDADLEATDYGQAFKSLRDNLPSSPVV